MKVLLILIFFQGCSKLSYITKQGVGQFKIIYQSRDNQQILSDEKIEPGIKLKISKILEYKRYFYRYFKERPSKNYNKTTLLDQKAVSYLIIASKKNEIKAKKECFPFVGCFPYLGFFDRPDILDYQKSLEARGLSTYIRPVYAYSTLGYFNDPILSSFFYYDDYDLAELVFHELFHTLFFPADEVDLNENMANFFARKMVREYFNNSKEVIDNKLRIEKNHRELRQRIVLLTEELKSLYKTNKASDSGQLLKGFLAKRFYPEIKKICKKLKLSTEECYPLNGQWNNARFVAYMTYEKEEKKIEKLFLEKNLNLLAFYKYLKKSYEEFSAEQIDMSFSDYLFKQ